MFSRGRVRGFPIPGTLACARPSYSYEILSFSVPGTVKNTPPGHMNRLVDKAVKPYVTRY